MGDMPDPYRSRLRELPEADRPREKLQAQGASALTDSELIAILLRTGLQGINAVELARQLLLKFGSLQQLARASWKEIAAVKGIGPTKATQLAAAFGLGHRLAREQVAQERVDSPDLVYALLGPSLRALSNEVLQVLLLDTRCCLMRVEEISRGSLNESIAHPRDIFRPAIAWNAYGLIVAHNHPSGDPTPSEADRSLTRRLVEAAHLLQVRLFDHVIIGAPRVSGPPYFSFRESGLL